MLGRIARPTTIAWTLAFVCCLALTAGCAPGVSTRSAPSRAPAILSVENDAFNDLEVFVTMDGSRQRLGLAPGMRTTNFTIPRSFVGGSTVRFLAHEIAGSRPEVSQQTSVAPGDTVSMIIQR